MELSALDVTGRFELFHDRVQRLLPGHAKMAVQSVDLPELLVFDVEQRRIAPQELRHTGRQVRPAQRPCKLDNTPLSSRDV